MFQDAEAYERFMGRWSRVAAPLLVDFAGLPERGWILDAGSGTGSLTFAIGDRLPRARVLGIDRSKEYVAYATNRNPFSDRASFEVGDAQCLPFDRASFDGAVSLLVFNFIPDPKKALRELCRVTKPGSPIAAAVWDYSDGMKMLRTFWDAATATDPGAGQADEKHMPLCRKGELSALWNEGGLEKVREEAIGIRMEFETFADYWEPFLLGQGPAGAYVRHLAGDKVEALRSELKRRLGLAGEDQRFVLDARVWAVRGIVRG